MAGRRLTWISEFIVGALDSDKYPLVKWLDRSTGTFLAPAARNDVIPLDSLQFFIDFKRECLSKGLHPRDLLGSPITAFGKICTTSRRLRRLPGEEYEVVQGINCRRWRLLCAEVKECWWCVHARTHLHSGSSLWEILYQHSVRLEKHRRRPRPFVGENSDSSEEDHPAFCDVPVTQTGAESEDSGDEGPSKRHSASGVQPVDDANADSPGSGDEGPSTRHSDSQPPPADEPTVHTDNVEDDLTLLDKESACALMYHVGQEMDMLMRAMGDEDLFDLLGIPEDVIATSQPGGDTDASGVVTEGSIAASALGAGVEDVYLAGALEAQNVAGEYVLEISDEEVDDGAGLPPASRRRPVVGEFLWDDGPRRHERPTTRRIRHRKLRSAYYRVLRPPVMITDRLGVEVFYFGRPAMSLEVERKVFILCSQNPLADISHSCLHSRKGLRVLLPKPDDNNTGPGDVNLLAAVLRSFASGLVIVSLRSGIYVKNLCKSTVLYHGNNPPKKFGVICGLSSRAVLDVFNVQQYRIQGHENIKKATVFIGGDPTSAEQFDMVPLVIKLRLRSVTCDD
nr:vIRF-3 [Human gammaherpesvirus 8]UQT62522.1 vIRF-3 [Human gammaherpesvirus 8]UQT62605.1 vIRF-3 [Human gammaherpesvirus 8]UQT63023.1 vIRF-3 [Human gammaherpesvirus 8]UQT64808.1 vIRF-3 [Human gammaherpesvirus 8]